MVSDFHKSILPETYDRRQFFGRLRRGILEELAIRRYASADLPENRFLLFAQGRSGSTLVTNTLDQHSQIHCEDEILRTPRLAPIRYAENRARRNQGLGFGFHVKIYQLIAWQRVNDVSAWLTRMHERGWKILFLWRGNKLEQIVSNAYAEAAGQYFFYSDNDRKRPDQITLDLDRLIPDLDYRQRRSIHEREALSGVPFLELHYETDLKPAEAQAETFARIQDYLGVPQENLVPSLSKSVKKPMSDVIANFDDVRERLAGTDYEKFVA